jgi:hypothetical protein
VKAEKVQVLAIYLPTYFRLCLVHTRKATFANNKGEKNPLVILTNVLLFHSFAERSVVEKKKNVKIEDI